MDAYYLFWPLILGIIELDTYYVIHFFSHFSHTSCPPAFWIKGNQPWIPERRRYIFCPGAPSLYTSTLRASLGEWCQVCVRTAVFTPLRPPNIILYQWRTGARNVPQKIYLEPIRRIQTEDVNERYASALRVSPLCQVHSSESCSWRGT